MLDDKTGYSHAELREWDPFVSVPNASRSIHQSSATFPSLADIHHFIGVEDNFLCSISTCQVHTPLARS